ncbi:MAG: GyrI-like domain-containing protein, partial [Phycisphaerae bacterium]|nr:GyrI-like domain-containing protein [Saprospiraceae bacterium]
KDFENGLANLKKYCEALAPKKYRGFAVLEAERPITYYALLRQVVDFKDLSQYLSDHFPTLQQAAEKAGAKTTGFQSGFFWTYDTLAMKTDMAAAIPLDKQVKMPDTIQVLSLGGKALQIEYLGDYDKAGEAHLAMDEYMAEKKLQNVPPVIEEYVVDANKEPDTAKWVMRVIYFVEPKRDSTLLNEKK